MKRILFAAPLLLLLAACSPAPQHSDAVATSAVSPPATIAGAPVASAADPATSAPPSGATPADSAAILTRYHWRLASAIGKDGQPIAALLARADKPLQLDFTAGALSVSNTCNRMHGRYTLAGGTLELGAMASTMMACTDPALDALDTAVGKYLHGALAFAADASEASPQLILTTADGDKLVFTGVPTSETRYGSKGTTEFLEIAAETKPCNHPGMPNAQCLEVRELHYDAQGLRTGAPGPWHVFTQPIKGFTHESGVRNVLRVKRYAIANPPADSPSAAYVLDMVVESEAPRERVK